MNFCKRNFYFRKVVLIGTNLLFCVLVIFQMLIRYENTKARIFYFKLGICGFIGIGVLIGQIFQIFQIEDNINSIWLEYTLYFLTIFKYLLKRTKNNYLDLIQNFLKKTFIIRLIITKTIFSFIILLHINIFYLYFFTEEPWDKDIFYSTLNLFTMQKLENRNIIVILFSLILKYYVKKNVISYFCR